MYTTEASGSMQLPPPLECIDIHVGPVRDAAAAATAHGPISLLVTVQNKQSSQIMRDVRLVVDYCSSEPSLRMPQSMCLSSRATSIEPGASARLVALLEVPWEVTALGLDVALYATYSTWSQSPNAPQSPAASQRKTTQHLATLSVDSQMRMFVSWPHFESGSARGGARRPNAAGVADLPYRITLRVEAGVGVGGSSAGAAVAALNALDPEFKLFVTSESDGARSESLRELLFARATIRDSPFVVLSADCDARLLAFLRGIAAPTRSRAASQTALSVVSPLVSGYTFCETHVAQFRTLLQSRVRAGAGIGPHELVGLYMHLARAYAFAFQ